MQWLNLWPLDTCNQGLLEGKFLGDQVFTVLKYYSENTEYDGAGWLLLTVLEKLRQEDNELLVL